MKKTLVLLVGVLILSFLFTACGASAPTPTDVSAGDATNAGDTVSVDESASDNEMNRDEDADVQTNANGMSDNTGSSQTDKIDSTQGLDESDFDALTLSEGYPVFSSHTGLANWLSAENPSVFNEYQAGIASAMTSGSLIQYYRPSEVENFMVLDHVKVFSGTKMTYVYTSNGGTNEDAELRVAIQTGNSKNAYKDLYDEAKSKFEQGMSGYSQHQYNGLTFYCFTNTKQTAMNLYWYQQGGYQFALLMDAETLPEVNTLLQFINLEQVTLRTDKATQ